MQEVSPSAGLSPASLISPGGHAVQAPPDTCSFSAHGAGAGAGASHKSGFPARSASAIQSSPAAYAHPSAAQQAALSPL